ncbi:Breast cancer anti-estrogen resistance protein 3 [Holothuria leucospilota]|uniref:Breast cancer anti-estrogen resistance protein 3 n=1 Tax=Holothuria leucospilota TaxID=206669 RepID=A0A9Q1H1M1_HOLLE|nr:Breast cancer anti-estrogen resistance protein 3 [Holothuria leucospilota]
MFMYNNTYAVYRKSDRAVAVLTNAQFQGNPPAMLDGSKFGNLLSEVEFVLMYAVAKVDHCNVRGLKFYQNDVILILAECRDTFVGITPRKRVGIFPSNLVHTISKRRKCIFKGMVLKMTTPNNFLEKNYDSSSLHNDSTVYEITKSSKGIFSWMEEEGWEVSLHGLVEKSLITEKLQQDDGNYEVIHEISYGGITLQQKKKMPLPQPGGEEDAFSQGDSSLQGESWFHGNLSRNEAERLLTKDGDFLVRFMSNYPWVYVLSCKTENGYEHFRLRLNNGSYYHTNGGYFRSIRTLIQVHQSEGKPVSKDPSTIIRRAVKRTICENSSLEEDISQGNDNEISKEREEEEEQVNSDEQVFTIQQSCEYNTSFGANFANNHEELLCVSEYQEVPPRTAHMKEFYPDLERLNTKQDSDCQRGKEENFDERYLWEFGEYYVKDHSVKGLVKVFNSYDSKQSHEDHYSDDKNSRGRGVIEEEVPSTEAENDSKDGKHECRSDNDSKSLVLEMKEIRGEVESVKSLMKSFIKMSIYPESIEQDKLSSKSVNHSESVESTDEKTYTDTVVDFDKELHEVDLSPEETYIDTVVDNDKELHVVDLSPEEQEDAQRRIHLKQDLYLYWHMEINDQLRDIVAAYLEPEFFHDVGKKLGVHKNRRTQIELEKTDIVERTYELLGQWHQKQGHMATIGKLIECLEPFDPEDFTTILEELCEELGDNYSWFT